MNASIKSIKSVVRVPSAIEPSCLAKCYLYAVFIFIIGISAQSVYVTIYMQKSVLQLKHAVNAKIGFSSS